MNVTNPDTTQAFAKFVDLQQVFAQCETDLENIQIGCDKAQAETLDKYKAAYSAAKIVRDQAEAELKALVDQHPDWVDGSTVKTPFGVIQIRGGSRIDVPNPEATCALIDQECSKPGSLWKPEQLTRTVREPNLETLEALSDDQLKKLGCTRTKTRSITVKRVQVDLAKATKKKAQVANV